MVAALWRGVAMLGVLSLGWGAAFAADLRLFPEAGRTVPAEEITAEVPVFFRALRFNEATEEWNVDLVVSNRSDRAFASPLYLTIEQFSGTSGPLRVEELTADLPATRFIRLDPGGALEPGRVSAPRTLALGFQEGAGVPRLQLRVYGIAVGLPYALGLTRTLNGVGQPLPAVRVSERGPGGERLVTTDAHAGVATLGGAAGDYLWRFDKEGYLPVWRRETLAVGAVRLIPNPRLARRTASGVALAAGETGVVASADGAVRVELQPDESVVAALTVVDGQTLPAPLPQGWSPLRAFWMEGGSGRVAGQAELKPEGAIAPFESAAFVRWEPAEAAWKVVGTVAGSGTNAVRVTLEAWGAYALVVADPGRLAPPTAVVGGALRPSVLPPQPDPIYAAGGAVAPETSPASRVPELVTGAALVRITNGTGPLPSGLVLRTDVRETYLLQDGSRRFTASYETFVAAYRRPAGTVEAVLETLFPVRPQLIFGGDELSAATVAVDVLPRGRFRGGVFDARGGEVADGGVRLSAGAGGLTGPSAAVLRSLVASNFATLAGAGQTVEAAFELTMPELDPGRRLGLVISNAAPGRDYVLARVRSDARSIGLEPVERLRAGLYGAMTSLEPGAGGEGLGGLRTAGQYLLVRVPGPHGLVSGVVRDAGGRPAEGVAVTVAGQPWLTFSASNGFYRLVAPTGAVQVVATDLAGGDTDFVESVIPDPGLALGLDLGTRARGPRVVGVSPASGSRNVARVTSVVVTFSEPVNPGSLVNGGVQLLGSNGQPVTASVTLNQRGTRATLLPASPLAPAALHTIVISNRVIDLTGLPLEGPGAFVFTTQTDRLDREVARVTSYEPTNGLAILVGSAGLAEPEAPVILVNETTGRTATVLSKPDGSFSNSIPADVDDFLSAVVQNANGTRNTIPVSRQIFRDGSVALFNGGGILEAEGDGGPVQVLVEAGAIENKRRFKVEALGLAELLPILNNVVPARGKPLPRGLKISSEGRDPLGPIDVAIPVSEAELQQVGIPPGVRPEENVYVLVAPMKQDGETVFMVVDKLQYENGKLVTHSEPFPGANNLLNPADRVNEALQQSDLTSHFTPFSGFSSATVQALGVIPMVLGAKTQPIIFSGKVLEPTVNVASNQLSVRPLPGALVTVGPVGQNLFSATRPGRLNGGTLFCTTRPNGSYAMMMPHPTIGDPLNPAGGPEEFVLTAQHPSQFGRRVELLSPAQVSNARLADLVFPASVQGVNDPNPPRVSVVHSPQFPLPGAPVTISVLATHGSDRPAITMVCESVALTASTNGVDCQLVQILPATIEEVGPTGRRMTFPVTCSTNARVVFRVRAVVNGAPESSVLYPVRFLDRESEVPNPEPSDANDRVGPRVVWSHPRHDPQGLAAGLSLGESIQIEFSEAVSSNGLSSAIQLTPNDGAPLLELSPDQRFLTLTYFGLRADTKYTLTLSSQIRDIAPAGNFLDQDPASGGFDPFILTFRTAPAVGGVLPGIEAGGGVVSRGIYAYALERAGPLDGAVVVYDLSNPAAPVKVAELSVPGFPRDIALIPNYAFTRNLARNPVETNDLLAVVGGKLGGGADEFGNLSPGFQYLWVIKIQRSDPPVLERLASAVVTLSPIAAVTKVQWSPPHLAYLESAADAQSVHIVNLQSFILGSHLPPSDFGAGADDGDDSNGDGDFVDPGDVLPLPNRSREEVAGKVGSFTVFDTNQRILDFDWNGRAGLLGAVLSAGRLLDAAGRPADPVPAAYRTLYADGLFLRREDASYEYPDAGPKRVRTLLDVPIPLTNGQFRLANLALASVEPAPSTPARIDVIEITDPSRPTLLRSITIPPVHGAVQSVVSREDGKLVVATSSDLLLLDPARLTLPPNPDGVHPALVGVIRGMGSGARAFGATLAGLGVVNLGGKHEVRQTSPTLGFIQLTTNTFANLTNLALRIGPTNTLHPRDLINRQQVVEALLENMEPASALQVAPFRTVPNVVDSQLSPPNPAAHYYVVVHAPGSAGETIDVALEGLNESGHPLLNKRLGFPPVRAMSAPALEALRQQPIPGFDAPIAPLKAYRLMADKTHPGYNVYLSKPFALTCEGMTLEDLARLRAELDREVLWSPHLLRAYLDPSLSAGEGGAAGNPVLGPFAGRHDARQGVMIPGAMATAAAFPADYIVGPNPPSPVGYATVPGSLGSVVVHSGEVRTETVDFALPSRRMPIVFKRVLGSQDLFDGPFGRGWDFGYNQRLRFLDPARIQSVCPCTMVLHGNGQGEIGRLRDVLFYTGEGQVLLYEFAGGNAPPQFASDPLVLQLGWLNKALAFYHSPTGVFDMMIQFKDRKFARLLPNGTQFWYSPAGRLEAVYDRYTNNVHVLRYNDRGELARIEDRSVQTPRYLDIGYYRNEGEAIASDSKDRPTSNRHQAGRIARLVDFTQDQLSQLPVRDVLFEYSEKGELEARKGIEVRTANPTGFTGRQQTRYTFGTSQNPASSPAQRALDYPLANGLSGIIGGDPNGGALLAVVEFAPDARVPVAKTVRGANGPVKLELGYDNTAASLVAGAGGAKVTTADEAKAEMTLDKFGLPKDATLSGAGAPSVTYKTARDEFGLPKEITYPLGNRVTFHYEPRSRNHRSKANVLRTETLPRAGGDSLLASFAYEERYNLQSGVQRDLNGNSVLYTPTPDGLDIGAIAYPQVGVDLPSGSPPVPIGLGATEEFRYNAFGQLERHKDVNGVVQKSVFDRPDGYPSASVEGEAAGLTTTFAYEGTSGLLGLPRRVSPPLNAPTDLTYDEREQLLTRNRAGLVSTYSYDENGRVVRQTSTVDPGVELEMRRSYLHNGFLRTNSTRFVEVGSQQTLEELKVEYEPDAMFRLQRVKYPNGEEKVIGPIDHLGRPQKIAYGAYTESYTYDDNNNLLTVTKGDAVTEYTYDGHDRVETVRVPVGGSRQETESRSYFNNGAVRESSVRDEANNLNRHATFQIDALGRTVATRVDAGAVPAVTLVSYDGNARLRRIVSPEGEVSGLQYDDAGRPQTGSNSVRRVQFTHDANGNLERSDSFEGLNLARRFSTTQTPFDALDRSTAMADDVGTISLVELRRLDGPVLKLRDGRGGLHQADFTRLGEPKRRLSPTGVEFRFAYDRNRQPTLEGDREDKGWSFQYDNTSRLTEHRLRDDQAFTYSAFDPRNQPQAIAFPGLSIDLGYDLQARISSRTARYNGHTRNETVSWDALDRPTARTFNAALDGRTVNGGLTHQYHPHGPLRLSTTSLNVGGGQHSFVLQHDVRRDGARTNVVYPSAQAVAEFRDLSGRLLAVTPASADPVVTDTVYEGADIIGTQTFGAGAVVCENVFDGRKRLLRRAYRRPGGAVLAELRYAYDGNNNVVARQSLHRAGRADFFAYDGDDRLVRADMGARPGIAGAGARTLSGFAVPLELNAGPDTWAPGLFARRFTYDSGGKLDRLTGSVPVNPDNLPLPPFVADIGGFDQSLHPGLIDGLARGRDSLANTTNTVLQVRIPGTDVPVPVAARLQYDGNSRLIRIARADGVVIDYEYLPSGLCAYRKVSGPAARCVPSERIFVWDGPRLLEEYDLAGPARTLRARYFYTDSEVPVAADLRIANTLQRFYFLVDIQGSLLGLADTQGQLVERYFYDAWGQPEIEPADVQPPVVRRVVSAADGLLIEFSERVLPPVVAESGAVSNQLRATLAGLANQLRLEQSGSTVPGGFVFEESRPGFAFGTVVRFQPSNTLSGPLVLRLQAGALNDEWNNPSVATNIAFVFNGAPGSVLATNLVATAPPRAGRTAGDQPFLFHGQYFDFDAGLVYLRARHYDPFTGLFLQPDPAGYADSVNLYAGFAHNPQSLRDPSGNLVFVPALAAIGAVAGGVIGGVAEYRHQNGVLNREVAAATVAGAVGGFFGGFTAGGSILVEGVLAGAAGGVSSGAVKMYIMGGDFTKYSGADALRDAASGAAVGALGAGGASVLGGLGRAIKSSLRELPGGIIPPGALRGRMAPVGAQVADRVQPIVARTRIPPPAAPVANSVQTEVIHRDAIVLERESARLKQAAMDFYRDARGFVEFSRNDHLDLIGAAGLHTPAGYAAKGSRPVVEYSLRNGRMAGGNAFAHEIFHARIHLGEIRNPFGRYTETNPKAIIWEEAMAFKQGFAWEMRMNRGPGQQFSSDLQQYMRGGDDWLLRTIARRYKVAESTALTLSKDLQP